MDLAAIRDVLNRALPMRSPYFPEGTAPAAKVAVLEDYMLAAALINGELVEARHWLRLLQAELADRWAGLQGWEVALRKARARATTADVQAAKVVVAPQLYAAGAEARRLRESVDDQIARFEREERAVSRAYTMTTGG
jgi:hypothetical protein